ncbi:unnamed protein product [Aphis gossypii]|uniref:Secreted protein n=1 Tax=Aphis gossypii TaxID=80765 RepID=A0A9P0NGE0_APHGO|nr:unnamed protein product [Aphis gossypii]
MSGTMQITSLLSTLLQTTVAVLMMCQSGTEAAPAEGLTPFGFLMARAYGQPAVNPVMRHIAFKPSDGCQISRIVRKKTRTPWTGSDRQLGTGFLQDWRGDSGEPIAEHGHHDFRRSFQ